jgi:hypothetical protein
MSTHIIRHDTVYRTSLLNGRTIQSTAPVVRCDCNREVLCDRFTNTCECGVDYNGSGQLLASREQWGIETNESVADILAADTDPFGGDA